VGRWSLSLLAALALCVAPSTSHALEGVVYVDADDDGVRDTREAVLADVVVSNGREVTRSGADGVWSLEEGPDGFVRITCPDDYRCPRWYREGSGDFGLVPTPTPDEFFFIQVSDVHAFDEAGDFATWSSPPIPAWLPDRIAYWLVLYRLGQGYPHLSRSQIAEAFRRKLDPRRFGEELSDSAVIGAYGDEFRRPGSALGRVKESVEAALAEVAALRPEFVIDTGDLVLESNRAPAPVVERWFRFYDAATKATGVPWVPTIGNNEIAGIQNPDFAADDPQFGKHFFHTFYGPSWFSFDRGAFHFVALDTHKPDPEDSDPKEWLFTEMPDAELAWLDADLAAHDGKVAVVLNHEPFAIDQNWPFADDLEPVESGGLFERHRVAYTLTGHVHSNGLAREGPTTHITTGALSGMRWIVPTVVHPRGYRLFYAREGRLYSAWKELGEPTLGLVVPPASPEIAPAADPNSADGGLIVVVAADVTEPFAEVTVSVDGEPLPLERWGDYFFAAQPPGGALREGARVQLRALTKSGALNKLQLTVSTRDPAP
jgi:3',5'-cyclic AMP phosphodiesterase CpdA